MSGILTGLRDVQSRLAELASAGGPSPAADGSDGGSGGTGAGAGASFASLLQQSLADVNASQQQASQLSTEFEQGDPKASLPQVMIAVEKANLAFDGAVQVRNKLVDAYNQVMGMQV